VIVEVGRSGLIEAVHPVAAAAVDSSGRVVDAFGIDVDREFFGRSAFKPFQAAVSQRNGAGLGPEQMAVATSSHSGHPIHVAFVRSMLSEQGLGEQHLRCPPDRPSSLAADRLSAVMGSSEPAAVFHNCSGKHAAMLRACASSGWSLEYLAPGHTIHQEVMEIVEDATARPVTPVGVDGCGIPTLRTDVTALARGFARLTVDPELRAVADAAARFTALTADGDRREDEIARWVPAVVKAGAMGCIAAAWLEGGVGFAAKAWTGDPVAAAVALVALMDRSGVLSAYQRERLGAVASPPVLGGGSPVGRYELVGL
jgi:L-asparaginase II